MLRRDEHYVVGRVLLLLLKRFVVLSWTLCTEMIAVTHKWGNIIDECCKGDIMASIMG